MFKPWKRQLAPTGSPVTYGDFRRLVNRVADLERAVRRIEQKLDTRLLADKTSYHWGNQPGDPYYHRDSVGEYGDLSGVLARVRPWLSTTARFSEALTSPESAKTTLMQAVTMGLVGGALGGVIYLLAPNNNVPFEIIPVSMLTGLAISGGLLVLSDRVDRHALVKGQADREKRQQELRIQVDNANDTGISFIYLNSDVSEAQLKEFARRVLGGASLSVHKWVGQGSLFTRGQYEDLMTELERMGYVNPGRGPTPRTLRKKGRALMRGLIEN